MSDPHRLGEPPTGDVDSLLTCYLQVVDPATAPADPTLIDAIIHYSTTVGDGDDRWLGWVRYAHRAAHELHGPDHERTLLATRVLASTLSCRDEQAAAAHQWRVLRDTYRRIGSVPGTIGAHTELALAWHAAGRCGEAIREVHQAFTLWRLHHPDAHRLGMYVLATYIPMLTACQRHAEAASLTTWARTHLPSPLAPPSAAFTAATRLSYSAEVSGHAEVCAINLDHLLTAEASTAPQPAPQRHRFHRAAAWLHYHTPL